jgi:hypothetical protein
MSNYKTVSQIRCETASGLDIESFREMQKKEFYVLAVKSCF